MEKVEIKSSGRGAEAWVAVSQDFDPTRGMGNMRVVRLEVDCPREFRHVDLTPGQARRIGEALLAAADASS